MQHVPDVNWELSIFTQFVKWPRALEFACWVKEAEEVFTVNGIHLYLVAWTFDVNDQLKQRHNQHAHQKMNGGIRKKPCVHSVQHWDKDGRSNLGRKIFQTDFTGTCSKELESHRILPYTPTHKILHGQFTHQVVAACSSVPILKSACADCKQNLVNVSPLVVSVYW